MSKLDQINQANLTVGPTSMYDSSVAMKNALRKRPIIYLIEISI